jgi:uncharacterized membrane protein
MGIERGASPSNGEFDGASAGALRSNGGTRTAVSARIREGVSRHEPEYHGQNATHGAQQRAVALGWLSVGLGVAGLVAPGQIARTVGARDRVGTRWLVRALGLRELLSGAGILLGAPRPSWLWSRVAGDAIDLALLGGALGSGKLGRGRGLAATAAIAGIAALDGKTALDLEQHPRDARMRAVYVTASLTINLPPERVYRFWRELPNLARFMAHLESVEVREPHVHFRARLPAGVCLEWDAQITEDRPNERITWRSLPGAELENHGMVRFVPAPGERGTEVHVMLSYQPPAGAVGAGFAKLFGKLPAQQLRQDLRRFKQLLETGDMARSDASVHRGPHPARPSALRLEPPIETSNEEEVTR